MPKVARITIFPIKSLDGVDVTASEVLATGPLQNDRRYAILDAAGNLINGKRTPDIHLIRASYSADGETVHLSHARAEFPAATFHMHTDRAALEEWLSRALGTQCTLRENAQTGFPDDAHSPGPTMVSTETLEEVACWFNLSLDEVRRRFRANLEIAAGEVFWEDRVYTASPQRPVPFTIGSIRWHGINSCTRCVVPTREATTGESLRGFAKQFAMLREQTLPPWAPREAFDHFYRLAVNTRLATGQTPPFVVRLGDDVRLA